jgi:hypothetical protein
MMILILVVILNVRTLRPSVVLGFRLLGREFFTLSFIVFFLAAVATRPLFFSLFLICAARGRETRQILAPALAL